MSAAIDFRDWIGKTETRSERLSQPLVERFVATLGETLAHGSGEAPLGIHWCLMPPVAPRDALSEDGHPVRGGFLPPVSLPRRMWAGGSLVFRGSLSAEQEVTRTSRIADIQEKAGRAGRMVLVRVDHAIEVDGTLAIEEIQTIVFLGTQPSGPGEPAGGKKPAPKPDLSEKVEADPVLLFRYSALTFNGHRIHYDADYTRRVENYPALVIHGPLQATLLMNMAARLGEGPLRSFVYRGVAPLFLDAAFTLNAKRTEAGWSLWTAGADGVVRMQAEAEFAQGAACRPHHVRKGAE